MGAWNWANRVEYCKCMGYFRLQQWLSEFALWRWILNPWCLSVVEFLPFLGTKTTNQTKNAQKSAALLSYCVNGLHLSTKPTTQHKRAAGKWPHPTGQRSPHLGSFFDEERKMLANPVSWYWLMASGTEKSSRRFAVTIPPLTLR